MTFLGRSGLDTDAKRDVSGGRVAASCRLLEHGNPPGQVEEDLVRFRDELLCSWNIAHEHRRFDVCQRFEEVEVFLVVGA